MAKIKLVIITVVLAFILPFQVSIQLAQTPKPAPQQPNGGVSTGTPVNYTSKRTVGIIDPKAPIVLEDVTDKSALGNFKHRAGNTTKDYIFEVPSGGVAIFDYVGDGWPDIYLVNGSTVPAMQGKEKAPRAALFRNLGNFKFEDVTDKAGVSNERWGMGVAVGDYDNDGRPDMFVSNFGVSRLYHNNGEGTFTDVAEKLGVAIQLLRARVFRNSAMSRLTPNRSKLELSQTLRISKKD